MTAKTAFFALFLVAGLAATKSARAHCEIPCGIYDDQLRANLIAEHITTIEKSIKQINELSAAKTRNHNQLARWVDNKEHHANELQHIVSQYFLTQRLKPTDSRDKSKYNKLVLELTTLHGMLVHAMKAKQTTDLAHTNKLRELLKRFNASYFGAGGH